MCVLSAEDARGLGDHDAIANVSYGPQVAFNENLVEDEAICDVYGERGDVDTEDVAEEGSEPCGEQDDLLQQRTKFLKRCCTAGLRMQERIHGNQCHVICRKRNTVMKVSRGQRGD